MNAATPSRSTGQDKVRERLAEIGELEALATEGPWAVAADEPWVVGGMFAPRMAGMCIAELSDDEEGRADARFIADARSSVPVLVAALTAVLDECARTIQFCSCSASAYDGGQAAAARRIASNIAAALGVTE